MEGWLTYCNTSPYLKCTTWSLRKAYICAIITTIPHPQKPLGVPFKFLFPIPSHSFSPGSSRQNLYDFRLACLFWSFMSIEPYKGLCFPVWSLSFCVFLFLFWDPSMLLCVFIVHSFLLLSSFSLHGSARNSSARLSVDIRVVSYK